MRRETAIDESLWTKLRLSTHTCPPYKTPQFASFSPSSNELRKGSDEVIQTQISYGKALCGELISLKIILTGTDTQLRRQVHPFGTYARWTVFKHTAARAKVQRSS